MIRNRRSSARTLALFSVLTKRPQSWQYGYELSQLTGLQSGTLYPILMRLCDRGLLESTWQPSPQPGRPPRHMYRLTDAGRLFAKSEVRRSAGEPVPSVPAGKYA
jgi:DNA-binding PadR family transcriptional regulator